ncbi:MAG: MFS transporter [SAR324 cluster bacterium]|nr:MFS transporter [SAR324 cluster bacterium]
MYNRAQIVDENFTRFVQQEQFPETSVTWKPEEVGLDRGSLLDLFESQCISRHLDLQARSLRKKNHSYYTIGSSGHEGNAVLGKVFRHTDMAFLHYRSCAMMIQRAKQKPDSTSIEDHLLAFVASAHDPISGGRHKVFGSASLFVPPQTSTIASHLPKSVGAAFSLHRAKELNIESKIPLDSIILCSFGDASVNHSTAQGAFNAAQWISFHKFPLPLIFICEDNGLGISVETPPSWIETLFKNRFGIKYIAGSGLDLLDAYRIAKEAEAYVRKSRKPVFLHLKMVRLMGHAGSDIELQYRRPEQVEKTEQDDPLLHSARILMTNHYLHAGEIIALYESIRTQVAECALRMIQYPKLQSAEEIMSSISPKIETPQHMLLPTEKERGSIFGKDSKRFEQQGNLAALLNLGLADILLQYPNTLIFGEDVASKGGVYQITAGLSEKFGFKRVFNSILDEQTILGMAIGLAHNGFLPIPEIQFLAYFHNAEDQIRGEAASLSFFSKGQFTNPMVVRIASFGYQKGFGGHFHNDNSLAVLRDIPGIIIACPSNGADAVQMLRTCTALAYEQKRVIVFLEPIALYASKDLHEAGDNQWMFSYPAIDKTIPFGEPGVYGEGDELAIISYANGHYLSRQVEKILKEQHQITAKIIDLRWLAPLNKEALIKEIQTSKRVLIVDECRQTGSLSEELITMMVENFPNLPKIRRITGHDSFIPLGEAWKYVLPDQKRILSAALELLK